MSQEDMFKKHGNMAMKQAEKLALLVCQKIVEEGIYPDVKAIKDETNVDIVYEKGTEQHALVYIAVESIEKTKGTLVDVGFDIGFYEEGETTDIKNCLNAALKEYTKDVGHGI
jgi:hypothetical protein